MTTTAIEYQTTTINNEIPKIKEKTNLYEEKTNYQMQSYNSLKFINNVFLIFYIILFSVIHLLLLVQYIQGIKRDEIADTIWLSFFFFYPYLIYYVERTIYFIITYFISLVYGQTYVYQFDQLFMLTDFYTDPNANVVKNSFNG